MKRRLGFSLIEMLLGLTVMVALTTATVAFVRQPRTKILNEACNLSRSELQLRVDEYQRTNGRLPSINLRELNGRTTPVSVCPLDGQAYQLDTATGMIRVHSH